MKLDVAEIIVGKSGEDDATIYRAFRNVFDSDDGQKVLHHICRQAGLFARAHADKMLTADQLWFLAGKQDLARLILTTATVPPAVPKAPPREEGSLLDKQG